MTLTSVILSASCVGLTGVILSDRFVGLTSVIVSGRFVGLPRVTLSDIAFSRFMALTRVTHYLILPPVVLWDKLVLQSSITK